MDIRDYIHFYIKHPVLIGNSTTIRYIEMVSKQSVCTGTNKNGIPTWFKASACKPILRKIESMTEEEMKDLYHLEYLYGTACTREEILKCYFSEGNFNCINVSWKRYPGAGYASGCDLMYMNKLSPKRFHYLISKGFDLWGLIEHGYAVDASTFSLTKTETP